MSLSVGVAFNRVRPHAIGPECIGLFPKAVTDFKVSEVFPAFRFTQPFPTVFMVKHGALAAQPFHIATAR